jgi:signal peptidase I
MSQERSGHEPPAGPDDPSESQANPEDAKPSEGTPWWAPEPDAGRAEAAMAPASYGVDPVRDEVYTSHDGDGLDDVPAALELSYTTADLGLSERAYERAFPYERADERRRRRSSGARMRRVGRELLETVVLALLIFFAVKAVVQNFRVEGASMEPSLNNEQYLLVNKAIYFKVNLDRVHDFLPFVPGGDGRDRHLFRAPKRGDVVVFRFPLDTSRDFIKRVIGVPGDTVEVRDGTVFINGNPLQEDYVQATANYTYGPKTVPEGHYFVLGDNRRNSFDSHAWGSNCSAQQQCDFVPEENIIGQAWISYWPFDTLGLVNNTSIKPQAP